METTWLVIMILMPLFGASKSRSLESLRAVGFGTSIGDSHPAGGVGLELRGQHPSWRREAEWRGKASMGDCPVSEVDGLRRRPPRGFESAGRNLNRHHHLPIWADEDMGRGTALNLLQPACV